MNTYFKLFLILLCLFGLNPSSLLGQMIDLSKSKIISLEKKDPLVLNAISVLQEEIDKGSGIMLNKVGKFPKQLQNRIVIGLEAGLDKFPMEYQQLIASMPVIKAEGYKIVVIPEKNTVLVVGHDSRGVLYGIGKLLRKLEIYPGQILLPNDLNIASTPRFPIRGHQMGYRPKTNAYDAFSVQQYDNYIRDMAIFGANSIEIMPPRTDDDFTNVHMKIPAIEMIVEQSKICDKYGMDVWMWYPNLGSDYTNPDSLKVEIEERRKVFKAIPRLDALFVPGGDPGDLEPDELFNWLKIEAEVLHEYHPNAKIWVSPQVFRPTKAWFDSFYEHINKNYPWLGGVVFGPWIKTPIKEIAERINPGIPIRRYPDITHNLSSQYPIPNWDLAYAITLGRESINPRPQDQKLIHNAFDQFAQGSISYSEGTNDDVNKIIWSDQDWDPETPVMETLRDYSRYFIGPKYTETVSSGLMALERNIQGPLLNNDGVITTLQQWQDLEKSASQEVLSNFRFQMGLIRAYFDAYQYRRLIYETELEQQAREILSTAKTIGPISAIEKAKNILYKAKKEPIMAQWKNRCLSLADDLFESIGAQLTVEKHFAAGGRGNFIDNIDVPLNDGMWLIDQLFTIEKNGSEAEKLVSINDLLQRNNPGPGGYYDNFGTPRSWNRVVSNHSYAEDPGGLNSPRVSFGVGLKGEEWVHEITAIGFDGHTTPLSWMNQVTTLYDEPLKMVYNGLDPKGSYVIKVAYTGRFRSKIKLTAENIPVHDFIKTGVQPIYEFKIPTEALQDGVLELEWTCGEGERGAQVSEIWIINQGNLGKE
ncbi:MULTISPECIES: alpha-glucuronidase family glycosyl hydrolase [Arenibacter]|uniref:alpha-glucuronidase family glycosyl hydrolase n=1 Tax=Arenibacter TaxID=178469 RepID=UPI001864F6E4|nr:MULTISPECIES: alpha-glucuronidase family glycosyl hydrolase [Arenibacter]